MMVSDDGHRLGIGSEKLRLEADKLGALLADHPTVTTICHESPDGDTVGAAIAMALVAQRLGCEVEVVSADDLPPPYLGLAAGLAVHGTPHLGPGVAIICDSATLERTGQLAVDCRAWLGASTIVNIDHHVTNSGFGQVNLVDPMAAASCEVVAEILPVLGVALDAPIASAILTGIVRDSNGFSTASTRPSTFRAAAETIEAGAQLEAIYRATLLEMPLATIDLWGRLLSTVERAADGRIVYTVLRPEHLEETGTDQHDAEGVAEFLMRGRGVEIGILFRDLGKSTRVSIRTARLIDAARLAGAFGGGGHSRRAGWIDALPWESVVARVVERCRTELG